MRKAPHQCAGGGLRESRRNFRNAPGLGLLRSNVHATLEAARELNSAVAQREQRIVAAATHILTGVDVRATLTHDDRTGQHVLAGEALDAQSLGLRIAPVLG